MESFYFNPVQT